MHNLMPNFARAALTSAFVAFAPASVATAQDFFVEANIIGIFYHELGHAIIDVEGVPIFGQEEDAADVFSIYLIDALFESESAEELAYEAAWGFLGEVYLRDSDLEDLPWWDVHGPDEQRFYNTVCIFYGADPETRGDFAEDLGLPEDRAEYCPEEYDLAAASWGLVLDDMEARGAGETLVFVGEIDSLAAELLAVEVADLNEIFSLAETVTVYVESCGEANAFYDPNALEIIFCAEFEDYLYEMEKVLTD